MAPSLTAAEIMARRRNYASSVKIKGTVKMDKGKQIAVVQEVSRDEEREKLRKWMEEKRRRDMEAMRRKKLAQDPAQGKKAPADVSGKKSAGEPVKNPAMKNKEKIAKSHSIAEVRADASVSIANETTNPKTQATKKVTFTGGPVSTPTAEKSKLVHRKTPKRPSSTPNFRRITEKSKSAALTPISITARTTPATDRSAIPARLSSKKFEKLSPHSKFDHWLRVKGKTPTQVKHIACVTPNRKSSLKPTHGKDSITDDDDEFFTRLVELRQKRNVEENKSAIELSSVSGANCVNRASYWLCLSHLALLDTKRAPSERRRRAFDSLSSGVERKAAPKELLVEEAAQIVSRMFDLEDQVPAAVKGKNSTFTLDEQLEKENIAGSPKGQAEVDPNESQILTPPASPSGSPTALGAVGPDVVLASTPSLPKPFPLDFQSLNASTDTRDSLAEPLPASASLVTTTPHFIGVRHSIRISGVSSGCSSMHDITNASTRAACDSEESEDDSLEVVEFGADGNFADSAANSEDYYSLRYRVEDAEVDAIGATASQLTLDGVDDVVDDVEDEEKENVSPLGSDDICSEMSHELMASPIFIEERPSPCKAIQDPSMISPPFAASAVRLALRPGAVSPDKEREAAGPLAEELKENIGENAEIESGAFYTPPSAFKSKFVATPVRRSIRQTPRAKATEEKRRLIGALSELSPESRAKTVLVPNPLILNQDFEQNEDD